MTRIVTIPRMDINPDGPCVLVYEVSWKGRNDIYLYFDREYAVAWSKYKYIGEVGTITNREVLLT